MKLVSYRQGTDHGYAVVAAGADGPAETATAIPVEGDFAASYPSIRAVLEGDALVHGRRGLVAKVGGRSDEGLAAGRGSDRCAMDRRQSEIGKVTDI